MKRLTRKRRRQFRHVLIACGIGVSFALITYFVQPFSSIQYRLSDMLFVPRDPSPNIVIAAIDNDTLNQYGRLAEWSRSLHAQAIENLDNAKAMAIGYDVLFASETANDSVLAQAMADAGNVVIAVAGDEDGQISSPTREITFQNVIHLATTLENASVATGHVSVLIGEGGIVREIPLVICEAEGETYPALMLSVLYTHFKQALPSQFVVDNGVMHLLDRDIPVDDTKSMRINYAGPPGTYTMISYADIIQGNFDPELVKFKMVLVGMTATGDPDSWVTPISPEKMYGVEIHANAMDTILNQIYLVEMSKVGTFLILLLLVGILGLALPFLNLRWGALLSILLFVAYALAVFFSFDYGHILNIMYPLLAVPLVYVTVLICRITSVQADRRDTKNIFGKYVSPQVAHEILNMADSDRLKLGGVRREVTVFFSDIRGFTAMSEKMSPEAVVDTLNRYLGIIIDCILANGGMINKFAGDSIMAIWNAPEDQPDHSVLAVKAALEAQQAAAKISVGADQPKVQFGIGINTGPALAGSIGTEGRAEYTVIGDTVNLASRICSGTPGGQVWIGSLTYEQVKTVAETVELAPQSFKGKAEPVKVYQVVKLLGEEGK
ncbi:MAG: adenylate/guanylate cyclase domain-containing protein [Dehalococcoidia bacterium]